MHLILGRGLKAKNAFSYFNAQGGYDYTPAESKNCYTAKGIIEVLSKPKDNRDPGWSNCYDGQHPVPHDSAAVQYHEHTTQDSTHTMYKDEFASDGGAAIAEATVKVPKNVWRIEAEGQDWIGRLGLPSVGNHQCPKTPPE